jgi:hypothetical protein
MSPSWGKKLAWWLSQNWRSDGFLARAGVVCLALLAGTAAASLLLDDYWQFSDWPRSSRIGDGADAGSVRGPAQLPRKPQQGGSSETVAAPVPSFGSAQGAEALLAPARGGAREGSGGGTGNRAGEGNPPDQGESDGPSDAGQQGAAQPGGEGAPGGGGDQEPLAPNAGEQPQAPPQVAGTTPPPSQPAEVDEGKNDKPNKPKKPKSHGNGNARGHHKGEPGGPPGQGGTVNAARPKSGKSAKPGKPGKPGKHGKAR